MRRSVLFGSVLVVMVLMFGLSGRAFSQQDTLKEAIYNPGLLKPVDSSLKVKPGQKAPDFTLPSVSGERISLSRFKCKKHVVLSFVPAAWTPVCSDQWPGYNITKDFFDQYHATLLGITVDNIPTLFAWTRQMGTLWFPVLSDFWPHGRVADTYGVLRTDGMSERAIILIDKDGVVQYAKVTNINQRPPLEDLIGALKALDHAFESKECE